MIQRAKACKGIIKHKGMINSQYFIVGIIKIRLFDISQMEGSKKESLEAYIAQARTNVEKLVKMNESGAWEENGKVKGEKPCIMYKAGVESRVASKGTVANVEGTLEQLDQLLHTEEYFYILDTQMIEFKNLEKLVDTPTEKIQINYLRFKGIGPVCDRDFVLVEIGLLDGNRYYHAAVSCNYPFPEVKGVVRGECFIGGYIGEKVDEKTLKVTYISDGDIKGSIPGFVKNIFSQGQGEVASRVDGCLKQLRAKKGK